MIMIKENVVADALRRKERINVMSLPKELVKKMKRLELEIKNSEDKEERIYEMLMQPEILGKKKSQELMIDERRSKLKGDEYFKC